MNTPAIVVSCLLAAVSASVVGWAVNQLPPLKANASNRVRVSMTIALTLIAGLVAAGISVTNSQAPAGGSNTASDSVPPESRSTGSVSAPHSAAPEPTASDPLIRQSHAKLSLRAGQSADLDQVGTDWGTPGTKQQPGKDIYANNSGNLEVEPDRYSLAILGHGRSYRDCASATNWDDEVIAPKAGMTVCVKTDGDRMALLLIREISKGTPKAFQVEAMVWE